MVVLFFFLASLGIVVFPPDVHDLSSSTVRNETKYEDRIG